MAEALDHGLAACWPPVQPASAAGVDVLHFELQQLQRCVGGAIAVLPLGRPAGSVAAVCLERAADQPYSAAEMLRLDATLQLVGPALDWMQRAGRPWHRRALDALHAAYQRLREPEQRLRRRWVMVGAAALAAVVLLPWTHEVGGRAELEGALQRVLATPVDGFVKTAHVRPGDRVAAGAPLLDLLEDDLNLERERWASQRAQHENACAAAMARTDRVGAATAMARVAEAQSQLALVDQHLGRSRLVAPFGGVVIAGDLSQSIGAPVRQGDTLITLASAEGYRVIVEVDEVDIARVQIGQSGRLSLGALPWRGEDIVVERIAPMARAVEGRNVFEFEARLQSPGRALRPGLLGRANLVVGHRPPLWAWLG
jgi:biotin carboxyl carrier protein